MNILVLEDEVQVLEMIQFTLAKEGHCVHLSNNAVDAYVKFLTEEIDLLIVDIRLPEIDGLFFSERVAHHLGKKTPIIVITGLDITDSELLEKINKISNIHQIYQKPVGANELCQYVSEASCWC